MEVNGEWLLVDDHRRRTGQTSGSLHVHLGEPTVVFRRPTRFMAGDGRKNPQAKQNEKTRLDFRRMMLAPQSRAVPSPQAGAFVSCQHRQGQE